MATLSDVVKQLKVNNTTVEKTNSHLENYFKSMERSRLDQLEALRESNKGGPAGAGATAGRDTKTSGGGIATLMAGIAALVAGFFTGILDSVKSLFKLTRLDKLFGSIKGLFTANGAIGKLFASFSARWMTYADDVAKFLKSAFAPITNVFQPNGAIGKLFLNMRLRWAMFADDAVRVIDDGIKPVRNLFSAEGRIAQLFKAITRPFTFPFEGFIDNVAKPFKSLFTAGEGGILSRIFSTIARPFTAAATFVGDEIKAIKSFIEGPIGKVFSTVRSAFSIFAEGSGLVKLLGGIGTVLGRLFFPLTLIMTAYDTVKGAIKGFEEGGWLGGIEGAITGLLNSIVGVPLDLLKSAVSWIAGKMGFSQVERILDSFSFEDLISTAVNGLFNVVKGAVNFLLEAAAVAVGAFWESGAEKIRSYKLDTSTPKQQPRLGQAETVDNWQEPGSFAIPASPQLVRKGMSTGVAPMLSSPTGMQNGIGSAISNRPPMTGIQNGIGSVLNGQRARTQAAAAQPATPTVISAGGNTTSNVSQNTTNMISGGMPATRDRNDRRAYD